MQRTDGATGPDLGDGLASYVRLLRHGPAGRPFLAAFIARLPISMAPLGILLLIEHSRGAYAIAGLVTGAYALGSAAGTPLWGRLMDRFGQVPVLLPTSLGSAGLLAALALSTVGGAPTWVLLACSAAAGLTYPPISPAIRSAYRIILPDPAARRVAFALDATSVELLFVGGPLLLSVLLALTPPVAPLLVTAGFMAGGGVAYCRTDAARRWRPGAAELGGSHPLQGGRRSAVTAPGVAAVLAVMLALSVGFGQLDTSMAATAGERLGSTDRVGLLFAAIAGGSTIGGLAFGARQWRLDERRAVAVLLGLFAVFLIAMATLVSFPTSPLWLLFPLLFLTGCTIAPTLIMQQSLLDHLSPAHRLNEAQAFLSAATTTGGAAGTAIAGFLIDGWGLTASFGGAAAGAALAAGIALASQSHWRAAAERLATTPAAVPDSSPPVP